MKEKDRANNRLSVFELEYMRNMAVFNMRHVMHEKKPAFRDSARKRLRQLPAGRAYRGLSDALARRLYESTRSQYEELLALYCPGETMDGFFPLADHYEPMTIDTCGAAAEDQLVLYHHIMEICFDNSFSPLPADL
jgi:hypothetical protein